MKNRLTFSLLVVVVVVAFWVPAQAANKEMVQLQTQVQALQDQMARMQQSFDERMGVMRNLIEQSTDNVNKMSAGVNMLQQTLQKQNSDLWYMVYVRYYGCVFFSQNWDSLGIPR